LTLLFCLQYSTSSVAMRILENELIIVAYTCLLQWLKKIKLEKHHYITNLYIVGE